MLILTRPVGNVKVNVNVNVKVGECDESINNNINKTSIVVGRLIVHTKYHHTICCYNIILY